MAYDISSQSQPLADGSLPVLTDAPRSDGEGAWSLDRKTYRAVRDALESGAPVARDFRTGLVVPDHLRGAGYSPADLHASSFASIDHQMAAFDAKYRKGAK